MRHNLLTVLIPETSSLQEIQIRDTAHTIGLGTIVRILAKSSAIQVSIVVVSAACRRAWPYDVRVAVVIVRARAATVLIGAL